MTTITLVYDDQPSFDNQSMRNRYRSYGVLSRDGAEERLSIAKAEEIARYGQEMFPACRMRDGRLGRTYHIHECRSTQIKSAYRAGASRMGTSGQILGGGYRATFSTFRE